MTSSPYFNPNTDFVSAANIINTPPTKSPRTSELYSLAYMIEQLQTLQQQITSQVNTINQSLSNIDTVQDDQNSQIDGNQQLLSALQSQLSQVTGQTSPVLPNPFSSLNYAKGVYDELNHVYQLTFNDPSHASLSIGQWFILHADKSNLAPASIKVDDLELVPLLAANKPIKAGNIIKDIPIMVVYLGTHFEVMSSLSQHISTGTLNHTIRSSADEGWLICDGKSIGNTGSTADYASDDYFDLFELLKINSPDHQQLDFQNDVIPLPDLRGRTLIGITANGINIGDWANKIGGIGGEAKHQLKSEEMPSHTHLMQKSGLHGHSMSTTGNHKHTTNKTGGHSHAMTSNGSHNHDAGLVFNAGGGGSGSVSTAGIDGHIDFKPSHWRKHVIRSAGSHKHTIGNAGDHAHSTNTTGNHAHTVYQNGEHIHVINPSGDGQSHNNIQPSMAVNIQIKV